MPFRDKIVDEIIRRQDQIAPVDEYEVRALVDEIVNIVHNRVKEKQSLTILGFGRFSYAVKQLKPSSGKRERALNIFRWSIASQRNKQLAELYTQAEKYSNVPMARVREKLTEMLNDAPIKSKVIVHELRKVGFPRKLALLSVHVFFSSVLLAALRGNVTLCDLGTFAMHRRIVTHIPTVKYAASGKARVIIFKEGNSVQTKLQESKQC